MLHDIPLYQQVGEPPVKSEIIVLCIQDDIQYVYNTFSQHYIRLIISDNYQEQQTILCNGKVIYISSDFTKILDYPYCYIVIFCSKQNFDILHWFYTKLEEIKIRHSYIFIPISRNLGTVTNYFPRFLMKYRDEIENVYDILNDDESRRIFASRIKSIISGNIGYIRQSDFPQYFHPALMPQPGDIILDGGVSGNVAVELKFSQLVGDEGHIYSFEPEPDCYYQAIEKTKNIKNITLLPFGLWDKCEKVNLTSEGAGSHVIGNSIDGITITCHMTMIDKIVKQYNIEKINMIKLDVEGSEKKSLLGGIKTIVKYRPKLLISLYHNRNDIFELPLFIYKLDLNYQFYLGHHRPSLQETILYAIPN
jgi:FkbM family methyltransferase